MLTEIIGIFKKTFLYKTVYMKTVKYYRLFILNFVYPLIYSVNARKPVEEKKALFIEYTHPVMSESFSVMYEKLKNDYSMDVKCVFCINGSGKPRQQRKRLKNAINEAATAKYVFFNEGNDKFSKIKYRDETVVTQLWHGCGAFKRFGLSTAESKFGATKEYMKAHPFYNGYDLVSVSSEDVVWAYEQAMGYTHESGVIKATGVSRTDVFFDKKYLSSSTDMVYAAVPQAKNKKVILYAPTFRGHVAQAYAPDFLDVEKMYNSLSDEWVLLIKQHPHVKNRKKIPDEYASFAFDVSDKLEINRILCVADVCISDYSSLVFEYSLFDRPMIFLSPDIEDYCDWRGFYYDYNDMTPGPVVSTTDEIVTFINDLPVSFDKEKLNAFRQKFMSACDGHSTDRIIKHIIKQ